MSTRIKDWSIVNEVVNENVNKYVKFNVNIFVNEIEGVNSWKLIEFVNCKPNGTVYSRI